MARSRKRSSTNLAAVAHFVVKEWLQNPSQDMNEHPDVDLLIAYQEGRLSTGDHRLVESHVADCRLCSQDLVELQQFEEEAAESISPEFPSAAKTAEDWARLQSVIAVREANIGNAGRPMKLAGRQYRGQSRLVRGWAIAASVLVSVVVSSLFWNVRDTDKDAEIIGKMPFLLDLQPDGERIDRANTTPPLLVRDEVDLLIFRLHVGDLASYDRYAIQVAKGPPGAELGQTEVERQPSGQFLLLVPSRDFPEGDYRLVLSAVDRRGSRTLAEYSFAMERTSD